MSKEKNIKIDGIFKHEKLLGILVHLLTGLGIVAENYRNISDASKLGLCMAMLLGRLEIFTMLLLFTPAFWRN